LFRPKGLQNLISRYCSKNLNAKTRCRKNGLFAQNVKKESTFNGFAGPGGRKNIMKSRKTKKTSF
jgi:hypothetical protein